MEIYGSTTSARGGGAIMTMYARKTRCRECKSPVFIDIINNLRICDCEAKYVNNIASVMNMDMWREVFWVPV